MLGASIGDEKARAALVDIGLRKSVDTRAMSREDALGLLDLLAETPGIIGVSSRFGRSRLMLKWARDDLRSSR